MEEKNINQNQVKKIKNQTASFYDTIAITILVVGIIVSLVAFMMYDANLIILISSFVVTFSTWFIVNTSKVIIQLLEDIKSK